MYKEIEDSAYLVNNTKDLRKAFESYVDKNTLNVPHENLLYNGSPIQKVVTCTLFGSTESGSLEGIERILRSKAIVTFTHLPAADGKSIVVMDILTPSQVLAHYQAFNLDDDEDEDDED
jgi:hypothetical protein